MKLDLLTNATVVDDAIRFVSSNQSKEKQKSSNSSEDEKESNEADYDEDKDQARRRARRGNRRKINNKPGFLEVKKY